MEVEYGSGYRCLDPSFVCFLCFVGSVEEFMSKLGPKLIESIQEALDGNFASVTMDGKRWVRLPDGYVVVPKVATNEMIFAAWETDAWKTSSGPYSEDIPTDIWNAMVKAAQE